MIFGGTTLGTRYSQNSEGMEGRVPPRSLKAGGSPWILPVESLAAFMRTQTGNGAWCWWWRGDQSILESWLCIKGQSLYFSGQTWQQVEGMWCGGRGRDLAENSYHCSLSSMVWELGKVSRKNRLRMRGGGGRRGKGKFGVWISRRRHLKTHYRFYRIGSTIFQHAVAGDGASNTWTFGRNCASKV